MNPKQMTEDEARVYIDGKLRIIQAALKAQNADAAIAVLASIKADGYPMVADSILSSIVAQSLRRYADRIDPPLPRTTRQLPTVEELFNNTYRRLGDAADELRSDWRPVGSALTERQAKARTDCFKAIDAAKAAINRR